MMQHLLTIEELSGKGRPFSAHMNRGRLTSFITEVEQLNIKPVLGEKLFLDLLEKGEEDETYRMLLEGGTYSWCDQTCSFVGLKAAVAYFVQAKWVMVGDFQNTRYGTVIKDGDYSSRLSAKERSDCYNDALEVANCYLRDCVAFCRRMGLMTGAPGMQRATGGMRIRKIGR